MVEQVSGGASPSNGSDTQHWGERNGDQPGCGPGEEQAACLTVLGTNGWGCSPGEEQATHPTVSGTSGCTCSPGEGQAACPMVLGASTCGVAQAKLPTHSPLWLWPARVKLAQVLGACGLLEEGILGPGCGAKQRQLEDWRGCKPG
ncbi:hypothetical protein MDA_GLEAN10012084 [Myotis davidii]|uniref:Uncharacterized protein n=1 Tax=Myotis davidii TaxID=225400 RepID=L5MG13_MYODS|nr:hypothetical protein MDA_GLEAN10012084 [Myotis davidii]